MVGVSDRPGNLGANVVRNLLDWGYDGELVALGRAACTVHGVPVLAPLDAVPDGVELGCLLTPARTVPGLVRALGERGTRSVVVQAGGFAELGDDGRSLGDDVLAAARSHGVRIVGPNGLGTIDARSGLCLPFARLRRLPPGAVSLVSQSGGVLFAYLRELEAAGLGLARAASVGNKLDIDAADLVRHLAGHGPTKVIALYLEDVRRGRALVEAVAAAGKPVILHKSNRSAATGRAAASHTASLLSDYAVVEAAARQAGIVLVDSVADSFTAIRAFLLPPLRGRRIAVVSRSGGHAVIAADACVRHGLELPPLPESLLDDLRRHVRAGVIRLSNPLDLGDLWDLDALQRVVERLAAHDGIDGVVFVHVAISPADGAVLRRLAEHVGEVSRRTAKPVAFCFHGWKDVSSEVLAAAGLPVFDAVEEAVEALALRARYDLRGAPPPAAALETAPDRRPVPLRACMELLQRHGIPMWTTRVARDVEEARALVAHLPGPFAAKLLSPQAVHKSDIGAVRLRLSADQVSAACEEMAADLRARLPHAEIEGFALQPLAPHGLELIVGFRRDPGFGPVVAVGLGGTLVEVLRDVSLRLAPVTAAEARGMLDELRGSALLAGARGAPPADIAALADLVARVSGLAVEAADELLELELNPVRVWEEGCAALDVRAFVAAETPVRSVG